MPEFAACKKNGQFKFPEPGKDNNGLWVKIGLDSAMSEKGVLIHVNPREQVVIVK